MKLLTVAIPCYNSESYMAVSYTHLGEAGIAARLAIGANELPGGSATDLLAVVEVKED